MGLRLHGRVVPADRVDAWFTLTVVEALSVIWEEMETCDDQNDVDADECTNACQLAECGDGVIWRTGVAVQR